MSKAIPPFLLWACDKGIEYVYIVEMDCNFKRFNAIIPNSSLTKNKLAF
jgi:hypothetical protein